MVGRPLSARLNTRTLFAVLGPGCLLALALAAAWHALGPRQVATIGVQDAVLYEKPLNLGGLDRSRLRSVASENPLDANVVTIAAMDLVGAVKDGSRSQERMYGLLSKLGWRSQTAQFAMMVRAARLDRADEVVRRVDALLRQDLLTDYAFQFLSAVEQQDADRPAAVALLSSKPHWTSVYLMKPQLLETEAQRAGRYDTFMQLARKGVVFDRPRLWMTINALADNGDRARAYALWRTLVRDTQPAILGDPNFSEASALDPQIGNLPTAFDWRLQSDQGTIVSYEGGSGGASAIRIEWDGRGGPVFARQTLRNAGGHIVQLTLKGAEAGTNAFQAIRIYAKCPQRNVDFVPQPSAKMVDEVRFVADGALPCQFPELLIAGKARQSAGPVDMAISELSATALQPSR